MMNSRLSMNGELPMTAPVTGSRSGAPGGSVGNQDHSQDAQEAVQRVLQAARLGGLARVVQLLGLRARRCRLP